MSDPIGQETVAPTPATPVATPVTAPPPVVPSTEGVPAPEGTPPPKEEDPKLTSRFAELSRREKRTVERERALKESEAKAKERETAYQAWEAAKARIKEDPSEALHLLDADLDSVITASLAKHKPATPEDRLAKLEEERKLEREALEAEKLTAQQKQVKEQVEGIRTNVREFIESQPDEYEMIIAEAAHDQVFDLLSDHFARKGKLLTYKQGAEIVESFLFEKASTLAKKSKKLAKLFEPPPPVEKPKAEKFTPKTEYKSAPTLTQTMNVVPTVRDPKVSEPHDAAITRIAAQMKAARMAKST